MHIINRNDIENMMDILHPILDESTLIHIDDEGLSKLLKHYWFLQQCAQDITANFPFSYEVVYIASTTGLLTLKTNTFQRLDMMEV